MRPYQKDLPTPIPRDKPIATPLALIGSFLLAIVIVGSLWIGGSVAYFPLTDVDFDTGRQLFQRRCSSCHSVEPGGSLGYGPNLSRIGALAGERVRGTTAEQFLIESILTPNAYRREGEQGVMPADISSGLCPEEVVSIVGYLTTLGGSPDREHLMSLVQGLEIASVDEQPMVDFDAVEAGRQLYLTKGKCHDCHPLKELPGFDLRAPALLRAGQHASDYLDQSIRNPHKQITAGYETWTVPMASGQLVSGRLVRRGSESIDLLVETNGDLHVTTIPIADLEIDEEGVPLMHLSRVSAMPDGISGALSQSEIDLIVQFLKTLK